MKTRNVFLILFGLWSIFLITTEIIAYYEYQKDVYSYWSLADKASTVNEKSIKVNLFVGKLDGLGFGGKHDAILFKTPDNSFDNNMVALKTLQQRLNDMQKMDINSFEYQTAMQQITAQEQGEANAMLSVFRGVWYKDNYIYLWSWIAGIQIAIIGIGLIVIGVAYLEDL